MVPQSRLGRQNQQLMRKGIGLMVGGLALLGSQPTWALSQIAPQRLAQTSTETTETETTETEASDRADTEETEASTTVSDQPRFECETVNGQYTVMYHPESQPGQAYPWAVPTSLGGGWSAERRCSEISRRLEFYRPDGLVEMRTAVENGYNTVCVTTESNPSCRIVLTVPPGQDPITTRNRVFENLAIADSGQQTQGINTFTGGRRDADEVDRLINLGISVLGGDRTPTRASGINLRPFLDRADGGTGARLQGGVPARSGPRLNPGNFR